MITTTRTALWGLIAAAALAAPIEAAAQQAITPTKRWIVKRTDANHYETSRFDIVVAEFDDRSAARAEAKRLNEKERLGSPYAFWALENPHWRRQPNASGDPVDQISPPPRPATPGGGQFHGRWKGTEGGSAVEFDLSPGGVARAYDGNGVWSGRWRMLSDTTVYIELTSPNNIRYSGQLSGDSIQGQARNVKTGKTWSFTISKASEPAPQPAPPKKPPLGIEGVYREAGSGSVLTILEGGNVVLKQPSGTFNGVVSAARSGNYDLVLEGRRWTLKRSGSFFVIDPRQARDFMSAYGGSYVWAK